MAFESGAGRGLAEVDAFNAPGAAILLRNLERCGSTEEGTEREREESKKEREAEAEAGRGRPWRLNELQECARKKKDCGTFVTLQIYTS